MVIDAIASQGVIKDKQDLGHTLRSHMEDPPEKRPQHVRLEQSDGFDHEDTPASTRHLEEELQRLHIVEQLKVDLGDNEFLRHVQQV